MLETQVLGH